MRKLLVIFLIIFSSNFYYAQTMGDFTETTNPTESWNFWIQSPVQDYRITLANVYANLLDRTNTWSGINTFTQSTEFDSTIEQTGYQRIYNNFVAGWGGTGFQLDYGLTVDGQTTLTIDNLFIRHDLNAYRLVARKIYAPNGNLLITSSAKVKEVSTDTTLIIFSNPDGDGYSSFDKGDLIRAQVFNARGSIIRTTEAEVDTTYSVTLPLFHLELFPIIKVTYHSGTRFIAGDDVVRIGNTTDPTRQSLIYLAADDQYSPFIQLKSGINSWAAETDSNNTIVWLGNFDGYTDPDFGVLSGSGLLAKNVYLKGKLDITGGPTYDEIQAKADAAALGNIAYVDSIAAAMMDHTIIIGGYIKTDLINVNTLLSQTITASGTITGATIQTASSGQRVVIAGGGGFAHEILLYASDGLSGELYGSTGGETIIDGSYVTLTNTGGSGMGLRVTGGPGNANNYLNTDGLSIGNNGDLYPYFIVNSTGQLTKVDNKDASSYSGYVLVSNGTSYTPTQLASSNISDFSSAVGDVINGTDVTELTDTGNHLVSSGDRTSWNGKSTITLGSATSQPFGGTYIDCKELIINGTGTGYYVLLPDY